MTTSTAGSGPYPIGFGIGRRLAVAAALIALVATSALTEEMTVTKPGGAVTEAERTDLLAFNDTWNRLAAALKDGGFEAFAAQYERDVLWLPPNAPRGRGDAMRAQFGFFTANPKAVIQHRLDHAFLAQSGELATVVGTYEFTLKDNPAASDTGKFTLVLIKRGGGWKIAADIFNSDKK